MSGFRRCVLALASALPADGIAARYPGDAGIGDDPRVLFADDFESCADAKDLDARWDARYHRVAVATAPEHVHAGRKSVEMTAPRQTTELSTALAKVLAKPVDLLHVRYYSKFDASSDITGSSHNGCDVSAGYFVDGGATPGIPANGANKFLVAFESWRGEAATKTPGEMNVYVYHPGQRSAFGDHFFPDGRVLPNTSLAGDFGTAFVPRPSFTPELGRWYCYELMVKANAPGRRDGLVKCWIDGEVVAEFTSLRLRDVDTLKIDRFGLSLHFGSNPSRETRKWYDDVVAATAYVGPRVPK